MSVADVLSFGDEEILVVEAVEVAGDEVEGRYR